ncbi:hypothetical protein CBF23_012860 [Marinomonas agarivorans]|nr:hypothetical protein CBF23_012860 [Marinomonas agarivorans]
MKYPSPLMTCLHHCRLILAFVFIFIVLEFLPWQVDRDIFVAALLFGFYSLYFERRQYITIFECHVEVEHILKPENTFRVSFK